ncbi:hypothetical protein SMSP2_01533 [Limihaloglobus sulfuriphilus]|uniref:DUF4411 family protein n=1 Tax=Limihaloglobus sulfuriphilus TaxID=1851148 RepID=A0A1Q2MFU1_9BACT|nr:DUF4411 family protein [Limihaloglobus sulfuriphilus]AQQ71167.1 hypothetical protein SMSP2_01533 [Limihaloglobus sulfuriphilus]
MIYLLDANIFIQAHRVYYPFDVFPVFWDWLKGEFQKGSIKSIDLVYKEIMRQEDKLSVWCRDLDGESWLSVQDEQTQKTYADIVNWIAGQDFKQTAKDKFLNDADPWLISKAKVTQFTVVTQETSDPKSKKKIFIPDVCNVFSVPYINTIQLTRKLGARF